LTNLPIIAAANPWMDLVFMYNSQDSRTALLVIYFYN
jgi:hypothetical protein